MLIVFSVGLLALVFVPFVVKVATGSDLAALASIAFVIGGFIWYLGRIKLPVAELVDFLSNLSTLELAGFGITAIISAIAVSVAVAVAIIFFLSLTNSTKK